MLSLRSRIVRTVRRLVGTEQILHSLARLADPVKAGRILPEPTFRSAAGERCRWVDLNGDLLALPDDLVKFIIHTRVSRSEEAIPKLLAETEHYLWTRERLHCGASALDIGANIGLFTVMMAQRVKYGQAGCIHAFEPSPGIFRDLGRVLQANGIDNVVANPLAVSDRSGQASFGDILADDAHRESSRLEGIQPASGSGGPIVRPVVVETITVDEYIDRHMIRPCLLKIDVEGAEFLVLEGARRFIEAEHPHLVIEIHPDANGWFDHNRLRAYLDQYGYRYRNRHKIYFCE